MIFKSRAKVLHFFCTKGGRFLKILRTFAGKKPRNFHLKGAQPVSVTKAARRETIFHRGERKKRRVLNNKTTSCLPQRIVAIFFLANDSHSKKELNCRKLVKAKTQIRWRKSCESAAKSMKRKRKRRRKAEPWHWNRWHNASLSVPSLLWVSDRREFPATFLPAYLKWNLFYVN